MNKGVGKRGARLPLVVAALLAVIGLWTYRHVVELLPPPWAPEGARPYRLVRVVDGDTIVVSPLRSREELRVRYIGVDAPELQAESGPEGYAREAAAANGDWLGAGTLWLVTDEQAEDEHGRLLAYVFAAERFVNLELVKQGYAEILLRRPNMRYAQEFLAAQQEAREARRGLWASVVTINEESLLRSAVGQMARMRGSVTAVVPGDDARPTVIRMALPFPDTPPLNLLLFPESRSLFPPDLEEQLTGAGIEVLGRLQRRNGQLQMIIRDPGQLLILPGGAEEEETSASAEERPSEVLDGPVASEEATGEI